MRTIAVVNQKGGCGKTITSINLSAFLAEERRRVLLVDMDPQGHATLGILRDAARVSPTMYEVFLPAGAGERASLADVIRPVAENLDLAPADILLSAIPETLAGRPGRENILADALAGISGRYDYVVVDCPPSVGLLTVNALKACVEAVIPMDPSFFSLHGIGKLLETFDVLAKDTDHRIAARVLVTLYSGRSSFVAAVVEEMRRHLYGLHFETVIRYSVKLAEAASHGVPVARYCKRCAGFDDYRAFAAEILRQEAALPTSEPIATAENPIDDSGHDAGPSAPVVTSEGVTFTFRAPAAERVHLAGDFNNWSLDGSEMELGGDIWKKVVKLPPGRYRYRYVVDGQWQSDPLNAAVEPSPYGGNDSILVTDQRVVD